MGFLSKGHTAHVDGLVRDCSISIANALEILNGDTAVLHWAMDVIWVDFAGLWCVLWHKDVMETLSALLALCQG